MRHDLNCLPGNTLQLPYDAIPPTRYALLKHNKRAASQGGHVWAQTDICIPQVPSPEHWGWMKENDNDRWKPKWTSLPVVVALCQEF